MPAAHAPVPALAVLLLAALAAPLSGCLQCVPQLDVHHCRAETGACDTSAEVVAPWDPALEERFPGLDRLLRTTPPGEHGHADWTAARGEDLLAYYGVPPEAEERHVFLTHEGGLFRVRVLAC